MTMKSVIHDVRQSVSQPKNTQKSTRREKGERTKRKYQLMMIFVRNDSQKDGKHQWECPQNEVVGLEKHEVDSLPTHRKVVVRYPQAYGKPK
jgi:hypothetical protein